ncbi:MAG: VTT domain-containing protein [Chloroflexi bacterium]|nr:VTT domain-containing protein [Chloroflexota bacterium]
MRHLAQLAGLPARIDWRKPENLVRLAILMVVIAAIAAALLLRGSFGATQVGYGAVALSALVASAGLVIPVPALATACATALFLNPFLVGVIAGSAETTGELSGYYLGYTGRDVLSRSRIYQRLERWMRRKGWLLLFIASLIPNPIFDVVGIAAGALRYPIWGFLAVVWLGKVLKFLIFAYACKAGSDWLTGLFGL